MPTVMSPLVQGRRSLPAAVMEQQQGCSASTAPSAHAVLFCAAGCSAAVRSSDAGAEGRGRACTAGRQQHKGRTRRHTTWLASPPGRWGQHEGQGRSGMGVWGEGAEPACPARPPPWAAGRDGGSGLPQPAAPGAPGCLAVVSISAPRVRVPAPPPSPIAPSPNTTATPPSSSRTAAGGRVRRVALTQAARRTYLWCYPCTCMATPLTKGTREGPS